MLVSPPVPERESRLVRHSADLVVVGGGVSGTCAAITAARAGAKVILVQDRPVLGGNASSEVRLWILGATSHMGNNNRWAREGGVIDELLVENAYRNPEGNPFFVDTLLLDKVVSEPNITLLLNTAVYDLEKSDADTIGSVRAFCSQNSTQYVLEAPLFCDASGDGIVGFMAGAAFRFGSELRGEFDEKFAPTSGTGDLLGHSIYFYTRDTGKPVKFVPPSFALTDITKIPRWRDFNSKEHGCKLWWIEHGGRLDTVYDTEKIKWELWQVVYGVWNHIKNSGRFPEAENLTLEWVGSIPGKRESRRFEGDYMMRQQDIVEQRSQPDAVAYGGWAIDLHPADGVFSDGPGCEQWHSKGVYQIPYRCLYSRNIKNLFLAGRIISVSHVAFGSTRVMATCGLIGQAVGMAAALCKRQKILPRAVGEGARIGELQRALLRIGHYIPGVRLDDPLDLAKKAAVSASSTLKFNGFSPDGPLLPLSNGWAMMLPVRKGTRISFTIPVLCTGKTQLRVELRQSAKAFNHTPDVVLEKKAISLESGSERPVAVSFSHVFPDERYAFVCFFGDQNVSLRASEERVTGVLSLVHQVNLAVAKSAVQEPPEDIGVDSFEFWQPQRRPRGQNLALRLDSPLEVFDAANALNGLSRPAKQPNAWVAEPVDPKPTLTLRWEAPQRIGRIELLFDPDYDHPLESVQMGHPERKMPFCVERYRIVDENGRELARRDDNHQARNVIRLEQPVTLKTLRIEIMTPNPRIPAALFEVRCYAPEAESELSR